MIDGEGEEHILVIDGARALDQVLDKPNEEKVQHGTDKEVEQEKSGRGEVGVDEENRKGDGEEEAAIAGELEEFQEVEREEGVEESVEMEGYGGVQVDQAAEGGWRWKCRWFGFHNSPHF